MDVGDLVMHKTDWQKGHRAPIGVVVSVHQPNEANRTHGWRGPKVRVRWSTHLSGGRRISGAGITTLIYCDTLQPVEVVPA